MRLSAFMFLFWVTWAGNAQIWQANEWQAGELPKTDTIELYKECEYSWYPAIQNGNVIATTDENEIFPTENNVSISDTVLTKVFRLFPAGRRSFIKVKDGFLVGVHNGVYRGGLWWIADDLKTGYHITSQKIIKFIRLGDRIFAIQDFPNLEVSKGNIIEIFGSGEKYAVKDVYELPAAPVDAVALADNSMIVVTAVAGKLIRVFESGEVNTLVSSGIWEELGPTNLATVSSEVYLGMKKGIYKYDLKKNSQEWLLPAEIKKRTRQKK